MIIINKRRTSVEELIGAIILWYGLAGDVPSGWEVYAPAKDAFVMGAASGAINTTATGANTHSHTRASGDTGSAANHTHTLSLVSEGSATITDGATTGSETNASLSTHGHTLQITSNASSAGAHTHTAPSVDSESHLPPYHRLYWIRRVAS
jgi:hypothetical protein